MGEPSSNQIVGFVIVSSTNPHWFYNPSEFYIPLCILLNHCQVILLLNASGHFLSTRVFIVHSHIWYELDRMLQMSKYSRY